MDSELLQYRLAEIQTRINGFKENMISSQANYTMALDLLTDPHLKSLLTEQHAIHTNRREAAMARMEKLQKEIEERLTRID